jgi:hypothetical protein
MRARQAARGVGGLAFAALLTLVALLPPKPAVAQNRAGAFGRPLGTVLARDEDGRLIGTNRYVWLTKSRVGVPVTIYEQLGIVVERDLDRRQIVLGVPRSDVSFTFRSERRRLLGQSANVRLTGPRFRYPVARLWRGRFYVAARVVQREFSDLVTTTWNHRTRTLTLQRTKELAPTQ